MYRIGKSFRFQAGHYLTGLAEGHHCMRQHGHTYGVEVVIEGGTLAPEGWLVDFGMVGDIVRDELKRGWEHFNLNDRVAQPTAENIARVLYDVLGAALSAGERPCHLARVRVAEDIGETWAEYEP